MIICPKCNTKNFNDSRECKNWGATKMTGDESDSDIGITFAISGGTYNETHVPRSTLSGGSFNITSAGSATIRGGSYNEAAGVYSTIGGGASITVNGQEDWAAGKYFQNN